MKCRKIVFIRFTYFTVDLNLTDSVVMFFGGVAATLAIVLVVLVLIWFYKRRRQTPKLSAGVLEVDTIEMQSELAPQQRQNNQVFTAWYIV